MMTHTHTHKYIYTGHGLRHWNTRQTHASEVKTKKHRHRQTVITSIEQYYKYAYISMMIVKYIFKQTQQMG